MICIFPCVLVDETILPRSSVLLSSFSPFFLLPSPFFLLAKSAIQSARLFICLLGSLQKIPQKLHNIVPKMIQDRGLEAVCAALWRLLGGSWAPHGSQAPVGCLLCDSWAAFWRLLSHLGRILGGPEAVFGTMLGRLGASWRHLGSFLEGFSRQDGAWLVSKFIESGILC